MSQMVAAVLDHNKDVVKENLISDNGGVRKLDIYSHVKQAVMLGGTQLQNALCAHPYYPEA